MKKYLLITILILLVSIINASLFDRTEIDDELQLKYSKIQEYGSGTKLLGDVTFHIFNQKEYNTEMYLEALMDGYWEGKNIGVGCQIFSHIPYQFVDQSGRLFQNLNENITTSSTYIDYNNAIGLRRIYMHIPNLNQVLKKILIGRLLIDYNTYIIANLYGIQGINISGGNGVVDYDMFYAPRKNGGFLTGGFIKAGYDYVPLLKDIPVLGNLFNKKYLFKVISVDYNNKVAVDTGNTKIEYSSFHDESVLIDFTYQFSKNLIFNNQLGINKRSQFNTNTIEYIPYNTYTSFGDWFSMEFKVKDMSMIIKYRYEGDTYHPQFSNSGWLANNEERGIDYGCNSVRLEFNLPIKDFVFSGYYDIVRRRSDLRLNSSNVSNQKSIDILYYGKYKQPGSYNANRLSLNISTNIYGINLVATFKKLETVEYYDYGQEKTTRFYNRLWAGTNITPSFLLYITITNQFVYFSPGNEIARAFEFNPLFIYTINENLNLKINTKFSYPNRVESDWIKNLDNYREQLWALDNFFKMSLEAKF